MWLAPTPDSATGELHAVQRSWQQWAPSAFLKMLASRMRLPGGVYAEPWDRARGKPGRNLGAAPGESVPPPPAGGYRSVDNVVPEVPV
jgi:hypothetical protein